MTSAGDVIHRALQVVANGKIKEDTALESGATEDRAYAVRSCFFFS